MISEFKEMFFKIFYQQSLRFFETDFRINGLSLGFHKQR